MKTAAVSTMVLLVLFALAAPGSSQVVFRLGGLFADEGRAIAVGPDGCIYAAGAFQGTVDFDPGPGLAERTAWGDPTDPLTGGDARDIYLVKLDPAGAFLWVKTFGAAGADAASAVAVDKNGDVWLAGTFKESVSFEGAEGVVRQLFSGPGQDAFLARFAPDGTCRWAVGLGDDEAAPFEPDDPRFEEIFGLTFDDDGNVYAVGAFAGEISLAGRPEPLISANGSRDGFIASFSPTGECRWAHSFGGDGWDEGRAVAVGPGPQPRLVAAGVFSGALSIQGQHFLSRGGTDILIIESTTGGSFDKFWTLGGQADDGVGPAALAMEATGGLLLAGEFGLTVDFAPGPAADVSLVSQGLADAFAALFAPDGSLIWAARMGGALDDGAAAVGLDAAGHAYVAGSYRGPAQFADGSSKIDLPALGGTAGDAFLAKFSPAGALLWARGFGGVPLADGDTQGSTGLALDASGRPLITGRFLGTADFDPEPGHQVLLSSAGRTDAFVARFDPGGGLADVRLLYPPLNFTGTRISNRSLAQREYIDMLSWTRNPGDPGTIVGFRIYEQEGETLTPVDEVGASIDRYLRRRVDPNKTIVYVLTAVDAAGSEGAAATTVVR